jgi:hypothetical protein
MTSALILGESPDGVKPEAVPGVYTPGTAQANVA